MDKPKLPPSRYTAISGMTSQPRLTGAERYRSERDDLVYKYLNVKEFTQDTSNMGRIYRVLSAYAGLSVDYFLNQMGKIEFNITAEGPSDSQMELYVKLVRLFTNLLECLEPTKAAAIAYPARKRLRLEMERLSHSPQLSDVTYHLRRAYLNSSIPTSLLASDGTDYSER